jgi:hypothetical protein
VVAVLGELTGASDAERVLFFRAAPSAVVSCGLDRPARAFATGMEGAYSSSASSSSSAAAAVQAGGRAGEVGIRVGATNIGRLRGAARQQQGKQQHGARGGVGVTSWHLRVFAAVVGVMGCVLLAASLAMSALHQVQFRNAVISRNFRGLKVCSSFSVAD